MNSHEQNQRNIPLRLTFATVVGNFLPRKLRRVIFYTIAKGTTLRDISECTAYYGTYWTVIDDMSEASKYIHMYIEHPKYLGKTELIFET